MKSKFFGKTLLALATLLSVVPAANAQFWNNPYGNQYGNPYGNQYGNPYGNQYGNPYVNRGGPGMISVQGVNQQRIAVYNRINQALYSGQIHQRQWGQLMRQLDTIQHEMRAANNGYDFISQDASVRISQRLSSLNNNLSRAMASRGGRFWF